MKHFSLRAASSEIGAIIILVVLGIVCSIATWDEHFPVSGSAAEQLAFTIANNDAAEPHVLILTRDIKSDRVFADALSAELQRLEVDIVETISVKAPSPANAGKQLKELAASGKKINLIATHHSGAGWRSISAERLAEMAQDHPSIQGIRVVEPESMMWPAFLTSENLVNILKNNAEVAIMAIGMTMVIITAGIDLSVGSLFALSGVITSIMIQRVAGGSDASAVGVIACCLIGVMSCALWGAFSGVMVTAFRVPAFIVTLALMEVARGLALKIAVHHQHLLSGGRTAGTPESVHVDYKSFEWLGNGVTFGVPNPILLMLLLYLVAHIVMTSTPLGRYIYAVGGNSEAARLSGVPVVTVLIIVYALCGALAGLGGVLDASRFGGGNPLAGKEYELKVIAAVVVGGTSLAGGEGRIIGTFIGVLIVAVIRNGLDLAHVESYNQKIIFGALILVAVVLDQLKRRWWKGGE